MRKDCVNIEAKHRIYVVRLLKLSISHVFSSDRREVDANCVVQSGVLEIKLLLNSLIVWPGRNEEFGILRGEGEIEK